MKKKQGDTMYVLGIPMPTGDNVAVPNRDTILMSEVLQGAMPEVQAEGAELASKYVIAVLVVSFLVNGQWDMSALTGPLEACQAADENVLAIRTDLADAMRLVSAKLGKEQYQVLGFEFHKGESIVFELKANFHLHDCRIDNIDYKREMCTLFVTLRIGA